MTTESQIAGTKKIRAYIPGNGTAGTADEFPIFEATRNIKITGVKFIARAAVTANGTNYYTMTLRNRGAAGAGTANPATRALSATNIAAFVSDPLTLSSTASDLLVAAGDVITVEKLVAASGLAMPSGTVEISYLER